MRVYQHLITSSSLGDIIERAVKTAIQTAAASGILGAAVGGDLPGMKTALLAATAAAISVVWNAALEWANR